MSSDINWYAVQFNSRDRRSDRIGNLLTLSIDVVEELTLLRIPEHATQHSIERGILELFRVRMSADQSEAPSSLGIVSP